MRIAIGGVMHESNTFSTTQTDRDAFQVHTGSAIVAAWADTHHEIGGYIQGADEFGYELYPTFMARATPGGTVTAEAYESLVRDLLDRIVDGPPIDGLLLALHGAMVSEEYPDGDGEIARRLRNVLGEDFPIVVTHDYHANISQQLVDAATALVVYKTNPHIDQRPRGLQAAEIITRVIRDGIDPVQSFEKPPMLLNIVHHNTDADPMKQVLQAAQTLEEENPAVLAANVAAGYQYADVREMGPSVVVTTAGDPDLAARAARQLADRLWNSRDRLAFSLPDAGEAVRQAKASAAHPVVLVDMGDNVGGGSAADSTFILAELLRQQAQSWVMVLRDPEAVTTCAQAGIGATLTLSVGGKTDDLHGSPVEVTGRVKCLHDGEFEETEPRHGGQRYHDQGHTAVLELAHAGPARSSFLVLTTHRQVPFSLHQLLSLGIQPQRQNILVVKAAIAYRAAYEPIAGRIIEVDTPGLTAVNPTRFTYHHVRRPLWGLNEWENSTDST